MLEVITGPMFSGKSEELIRMIKRYKIAKKNVLLFNNKLNTRDKSYIKSRNGNKIECKLINSLDEIIDIIISENTNNGKMIDVIGIDEIHLFNSSGIDKLIDITNIGIKVIVSGLDLDCYDNPFNITANLMCYADRIQKLTSICIVCGNICTRTQRFINNIADNDNKNKIMIIDDKKNIEYKPICKMCK